MIYYLANDTVFSFLSLYINDSLKISTSSSTHQWLWHNELINLLIPQVNAFTVFFSSWSDFLIFGYVWEEANIPGAFRQYDILKIKIHLFLDIQKPSQNHYSKILKIIRISPHGLLDLLFLRNMFGWNTFVMSGSWLPDRFLFDAGLQASFSLFLSRMLLSRSLADAVLNVCLRKGCERASRAVILLLMLKSSSLRSRS